MVQLSWVTSVAGLLVFGTATSVISKAVYGLHGEGLHGDVHPFVKPWFMVFLMFVAMSVCLPTYFVAHWLATKIARRRHRTLLEHQKRHYEWSMAFWIGAPAAFDLIATILMNLGLIFVSASVYQMMRGAEMLFAALFGVTFLRRRLALENYLGILLAIIGIFIVGLASVLGNEEDNKKGGTPHNGNNNHHHHHDDDNATVIMRHGGGGGGGGGGGVSVEQQLLGMGLIVLSQMVQAAQLTFEEHFLDHFQVNALLVVGFEGVWGIVIMTLLLVCMQYTPAADLGGLIPADVGGVVENTQDTLRMLSTTPLIAIVVVVQAVSLYAYNFTGMSVTGHFSAIFRTVLETLRTLFVWMVDLVLFYAHVQSGGKPLGESWNSYSVLQLVGFFCLVAATLVYARGDVKTVEIAAVNERRRRSLDSGLAPVKEEESDEEGGGDDESSPFIPRLVSAPRSLVNDDDDDDEHDMIYSLSASDLVYSTSAGKSSYGLSAASPSGGRARLSFSALRDDENS
ncbi:solute carrier family 35 protein [Pseudoscourfieldia marina]